MADKKIKGAVAIGGTVYRAGQEAELEAAAKEAKVDLSDERFTSSLEGYGSPSGKTKTKSDK